MLPPTGKYFNPIEMIFGDTKQKYEKMVGKKMKNRNPSGIPFKEKSTMWHKAESQVSADSFKRAYGERANGKEFVRVYKERELIDGE